MIIDHFDGNYRFLSNFHPVKVVFEGDEYPSVENAYQAAKTLIPSERYAIRLATPGAAKRLGKRVRLRSQWNELKLSIMLNLLDQKFKNPELRHLLLETKDVELIEGNEWGDTFWGVCKGLGQNHLGRLLMQIREEIRYYERSSSEEQTR
jgi:N-glycosidase YbiA